MSDNKTKCPFCGTSNESERYFCCKCGKFFRRDLSEDDSFYKEYEGNIARILQNLGKVPHYDIVWDNMSDVYTKKVERFRSILKLSEFASSIESGITEKMEDFLNLCRNPEFQIAFVGTIKTGKSTLINSLLGDNYASMAVTPETAALTKFRSSPKDYVKVSFYSKKEWDKLWKSRTSGADAFMKEYKELKADSIKKNWIGHEPIMEEMENDQIKNELKRWSSSAYPEHYFVKEIEVGISNLPASIPSSIVFVDTPGLSDPVAYRSEITKNYIKKASAVFVCIDAQKVQREEIETISSVFSISSHNKSKVFIIATHWDSFNFPEADWKRQKEYFMSRLIGKGFFDTPEMAEGNILYSAAFIHNLCRDFGKLSPQEKILIQMFVMKVGMMEKAMNPEMYLDDIKAKTNIDKISKIIQERLARNYRELLTSDIAAKYSDILYTVKRIGNEIKQETKEILDSAYSSTEDIKEQLDKKENDLKEIKKSASQLEAAMSNVETVTNQRLEAILSKIVIKADDQSE